MKAIKYWIFLALGVLSSNLLFAQNYPSGSLLWKISGNNLEKPSYILGTFHLKSGAYLDSIPGATAALNRSEQVVGELEMSNMQEMQIQMQSQMTMPTDTTYNMLYSTKEYDYVSEKLVTLLGANLDNIGNLKPAIIQQTLVIMSYARLIPESDQEDLLDVFIQQEAIRQQKPVLGLETVDEQMATLFSSSLQRQADLLLCFLEYSDEIILNEINDIIEYYNKADLDALSFYFSIDNDSLCPPTQEEIDTLIKNRNEQWMKKLPAMMQEKSSFIVVGAGHLLGEEGLLHQLELAGYTVLKMDAI